MDIIKSLGAVLKCAVLFILALPLIIIAGMEETEG